MIDRVGIPLNKDSVYSLVNKSLKGCRNGEERELGVVVKKIDNQFMIYEVENLRGIKGLKKMMDSEFYKDIESRYKKENSELNNYTRYIVLGKIIEDSLKSRTYLHEVYMLCKVKSYNELKVYLVQLNKIRKEKVELENKIKELEKKINKDSIEFDSKKEYLNKELSSKKEELSKLSENYRKVVKKLKTQPSSIYPSTPVKEEKNVRSIAELTKHNYVKDTECVERVRQLAIEGYTKGEIAKELGLSEGTIYTIKNTYNIDIQRKKRAKVETSLNEIQPLIDKGFTYKEIASYMKQLGKKGYSVANIVKLVKEGR